MLLANRLNISDKTVSKSDITVKQWIVYDILGNIGWIAYIFVLGKCFVKKPDFMGVWGLAAVVVLDVIPALMMLIGIAELINERIHKLDFVLPKIRVYRGFGALTSGGVLCAIFAGLCFKGYKKMD